MCDLYLGAPNSFATTPPNPFWTNPSIQSPSYVFTVGQTYSLDVELQNDDTEAGCSGALVNLYWSDPTTGFLIVAGQQIPAVGSPVQAIGAATTIPPADASVLFPFTWTPDATVAGTDGGHVCLAAIASSTTTDCIAPPPCGPGQQATTSSPQVAIHNVQVNMSAMGMRHPFPFFFGATNAGNLSGKTRLIARAYDPATKADHPKMRQLAALPAVRRAFGPGVKFGRPAEVLLALGAESIVVPSAPRKCAPRLSFTGPVATAYAEDLVKASWARTSAATAVVKEVDLLARQVQQAAVHVVPHEDDGSVYAVEVVHEFLGQGGPPTILGGLTVLFAGPGRYW